MHLTPASDHELEAVAALVNSAYRAPAGEAGWTHEADYIDGPRTDAQALRHELAASPGAAILVLREEAEASPTACVWLEPKAGGVWYLGMLSVRPDAQDRRLGRAVLEAAEAHAAARGARVMRMQVVGIRDSLIAWYERRGYVLTGETSPFPYDDQRFGAPRRDDLAFVTLEKPL